MVTRINHFEAKPELAGQLSSFLQGVVAVIKACPGCLDCRLLQATDDHASFAVIEQWDSVESHRRAASAIPREQLAEAMRLFAKPPSGTYYTAIV